MVYETILFLVYRLTPLYLPGTPNSRSADRNPQVLESHQDPSPLPPPICQSTHLGGRGPEGTFECG